MFSAYPWLSAFTAFLVQFSRTRAWGQDGHKRIAQIVQPLLKTQKRRERINGMLHGDLVDLANWEQNATGRWPGTAPLHVHRQNSEWTCDARSPPRCDGSISLVCAFAYSFQHLRVASRYGISNEPVHAPDELFAKCGIPAEILVPPFFLRWVITFVGDLHQPLHWLAKHNYGQSVNVHFRGRSYSLWSLWEDYIPQHFHAPPRDEIVLSQYDELVSKWRHKTPTDLFQEWAGEVAGVVCAQIYGKLEVNHADGSRRLDSPVHLTESMFETWLKLAEDLSILAGQRLAFLLKDMLRHKKNASTTGDLGTATRRNVRGASADGPSASFSDERAVGL